MLNMYADVRSMSAHGVLVSNFGTGSVVGVLPIASPILRCIPGARACTCSVPRKSSRPSLAEKVWVTREGDMEWMKRESVRVAVSCEMLFCCLL